MRFTWILAIVALLIVAGCTESAGDKTEKKDSKEIIGQKFKVEPGEVYKRIRNQSDTSYSYALYLPKKYGQTDTVFPAIYFFDAHKMGALPVKKYAMLAEQYGFILAGSNNSGNGQKEEETDRAISKLYGEISRQYRVDPSRVTTSGFSGGARVASGIALFRKENVSTVIGCAAGFPKVSMGYNSDFNYLAIVGDKDFNYLEMNNLNRMLEQTKIRHYLLVYDGKHEWPPVDVMREGFEYVLFNFMRKDPSYQKKDLIDKFKKRNDSIRNIARRKKNVPLLFQTDQKIVAFLEHLIPLKSYRSELDSLKKTQAYISWQKSEQNSELYEQKQQQLLVEAMKNKDKNWWLKEINGLYQKSDLVHKRLLNFLSLVSYMYASNQLKNNQLGDVSKYLTIYEKVDPDNPEAYYLKATLYAKTNHPEKVLAQLQKAADKKFVEYGRMKNDANFSSFQQDSTFRNILKQVLKNSSRDIIHFK